MRIRHLPPAAIAVVGGLAAVGLLTWTLASSKSGINTAANEQFSDVVATSGPAQSPPDKPVSDAARPNAPIQDNDSGQSKVVRSGPFRGIGGQSGSGRASIVTAGGQTYLRLANGFVVPEAADPQLGFGRSDKADNSTLFAKLKSSSGDQEYQLPASLNQDAYTQIVIYDKASGRSIAVADLVADPAAN